METETAAIIKGEKDISLKSDKNAEATKLKPAPGKSGKHKWKRVNSWEEVLEKMEEVENVNS